MLILAVVIVILKMEGVCLSFSHVYIVLILFYVILFVILS